MTSSKKEEVHRRIDESNNVRVWRQLAENDNLVLEDVLVVWQADLHSEFRADVMNQRRDPSAC
jgi:hypothetical protein